jgi:threonine aldolase
MLYAASHRAITELKAMGELPKRVRVRISKYLNNAIEQDHRRMKQRLRPLLFDTVYISLYKYFNAPFGAVLAGPKDLIAKIPVLRRQFGGGLLHAWEPAMVAMHFLNGFEGRYQSAVRNGNQLMSLLERTGRFQFEKVQGGSNVFGMSVTGVELKTLQERLRAAGIVIGATPQLQINETLNRRPVEEIAAEFKKALA